MQLSHGKHTGRIVTQTKDPLGRWVSQSLQIKNHKTITFITAYRPCDQAVTKGSGNTTVQQQHLQLKRRGINTHPRYQFDQDLQKFILTEQTNNREVVLGLDANPKDNDRPWTSLLRKCNLYDILADKYDKPTHTHQRGNRLDFIYGTRFIRDNTDSIGILDQRFGTTSDHAPLFIQLKPSLFSRNPNPIHPSQRGVKSNQAANFKKYGKLVDHKLRHNQHLSSLLDQLDSAPTEDLQQLCDHIDDILTITMLQTEKHIQRQSHTEYWSPIYKETKTALARAKRTLRSFRKTGRSRIPLPTSIPPRPKNQSTCQQQFVGGLQH